MAVDNNKETTSGGAFASSRLQSDIPVFELPSRPRRAPGPPLPDGVADQAFMPGIFPSVAGTEPCSSSNSPEMDLVPDLSSTGGSISSSDQSQHQQQRQHLQQPSPPPTIASRDASSPSIGNCAAFTPPPRQDDMRENYHADLLCSTSTPSAAVHRNRHHHAAAAAFMPPSDYQDLRSGLSPSTEQFLAPASGTRGSSSEPIATASGPFVFPPEWSFGGSDEADDHHHRRHMAEAAVAAGAHPTTTATSATTEGIFAHMLDINWDVSCPGPFD